MTTVPVTFALRGKDLVHINDVANGLGCGCVCPSCGDRMVAKQGLITIHHFAHEGGTECAGGLQTALHLAAKAVLSKECRMVLPDLTLTATAYDAKGVAHTVSKTVLSSQSIVFDAVTEEQRLGDIVPDLICKIGKRALLVEIAVTHFVDDIKRGKIQAQGLACVEIDLSSMLAAWNWDTLKHAVVESVTHKVWIEHPRITDLSSELQRQAQDEAGMSDQNDLIAKRLHTPEVQATLQRLAEFKEFEKSPEFQQERYAFNKEGPEHKVWLSAASMMKLEWSNPPNYLDIEVPGESIFLVARKVWQAGLYALILSQAKNGSNSFYSRIFSLKCGLIFPIRSGFELPREHMELLTESEKQSLPNIHTPIVAYLDALADLGYLKSESTDFGKTFFLQDGAPHWKGRRSGV